MPNWCNNQIMLVDCDEFFDKVAEKYLTTLEEGTFKETVLDFNKIIPTPKELEGTISPTPADADKEVIDNLVKKYGASNWYDWRVANWLTKWNCSDAFLTQSGMSFSTAWSPPIPVIQKLAEHLNKTIRLIYIEEGMNFCGEYVAYPDGTYDDAYYDSIKDAPESLLEELGYDPEMEDYFEE